MRITSNQLCDAANRAKLSRVKTLIDSKKQGLKSVFMCQSHLDQLLVKGIVVMLEESGDTQNGVLMEAV